MILAAKLGFIRKKTSYFTNMIFVIVLSSLIGDPIRDSPTWLEKHQLKVRGTLI